MEITRASSEQGSTYARCLIEELMSVHALTNMYRASGNEEFREAAARWLPSIERTLRLLRAALTPTEDKSDA